MTAVTGEMGEKRSMEHDEHRKEEANKPLAIVGIGASAGGLEAFEQFFRSMPPDTGFAFVLITHMDPAQRGHLPEILQRFTRMPVRETADGMKIEADTVYVKPARADLTIFHGTIGHLEPVRARGLRMPIDSFFQHLAEDQGGRAVGVVFSGTGSDGTLGIRAIKEHMGMVMAEDPSSARFSGMPGSAIATGLVDYIAPPGELPDLLIQYMKFSTTDPAGGVLTTPWVEADLKRIFSLIRLRTGQDFSRYKRNTVRRRIERRMALHHIPGIGGYITFLHENPQEIDVLAHDLLIGVTRFFRDPGAWVVLKEEILKDLLPAREPGGTIRAWIVGCSTGEEAYSLAILLRECLDVLERTDTIQVFATDVDTRAIGVARRGTYPANIVADLSPGRLKRFFVKKDNTYLVSKEIRECVIFATQNVLSDPPFTRLDILSCRNLLIYLSAELQKQVIPLFQYALNPGGLLFLGTAESIGGFDARFKTIDSRWKIFQRREGTPPQAPWLDTLAVIAQPTVAEGKGREFAREEAIVTALAQEWLLTQYAPPAVIVNDGGDILYFHGRTGRYLEPGPGRATLNIHTMARPAIRDALTPILQAATWGEESFARAAVPARVSAGERQVLLTVRPVGRWAMRGGMLYIVIFQDEEEVYQEHTGGEMEEGAVPAPVPEADPTHTIARVRFQLQHSLEDMQASQEELRSMNEELQSANEELKRTNEELTGSREELQSLNEELLAVNAEHQRKISELSERNDDMRNFLQVTNIAMLFLDNDLRVRRFTAPLQPIVNLQAGDVGRPITDLAVNLRYAEFLGDIRGVLRTLQMRKRPVQTRGGKWFEMRILPYRTIENRIEGVVVTFVDINRRKELESSIERARVYAEEIMAVVCEPLLVLDGELRVISANRPFYAAFQVPPGEAGGKSIYALKDGQWDIPRLRILLEEILPGEGEVEGFLVEHDLPGIGHRVMRINARIVRSEVGSDRILLAIEDATGSPL
ncbi:MAG: chemotaxis protein CheB [Methanomicrobiales archaeon]|nr:chemotaxis protein CheB [Methanomicrobiales archaeon]